MSIRWLDRRRKRTEPITAGERAGTEPGPITAWLDGLQHYDYDRPEYKSDTSYMDDKDAS